MLSRALAGIRQGFFYSKSFKLGGMFGIFSIVLMWGWFFGKKKMHSKKWVLVVMILATLCAILTMLALVRPGGILDIHLWAYLESLLWPLAMTLAGEDVVGILASAYTGSLIFSGTIQAMSGKSFLSALMKTDDPTGKTFGIPFLNIKIPRLANGWIKLGIAILLWGVYFANKYWWHNDWRIYKIFGIEVV